MNDGRSWSPAPSGCTDGETETQSQEGACPGGTVSESGPNRDMLAELPESEVGAGAGKKAAEGGVKGTGGGRGRRRVGTCSTPSSPAPSSREADRESLDSCLLRKASLSSGLWWGKSSLPVMSWESGWSRKAAG